MQPILFEIPGLGWPVAAYHTFLTLGFVAGIFLAYRLAARSGLDVNHMLDLALVAVIGGIFGSRLFYYAEFYDRHFRHRPWYHAFWVHEGGYVFYGGFLAAVLGCVGYLVIQASRAKRRGGAPVPILRTLDCCAPALPLGHALGRIGCFLNGCCWGRLDGWVDDLGAYHPGRALYSVCFPQGSPAWEVQHGSPRGWIPADAAWSLPVHATQLYEWAATTIICAILLVAHRYRWRDGQVGGAYFLLYGPTRFVIESYREHDPHAEMTRLPGISDAVAWLAASGPTWQWLRPDGSVTYSQLVSLGLVLVGVLWFATATLLGPRAPRALGSAQRAARLDSASDR